MVAVVVEADADADVAGAAATAPKLKPVVEAAGFAVAAATPALPAVQQRQEAAGNERLEASRQGGQHALLLSAVPRWFIVRTEVKRSCFVFYFNKVFDCVGEHAWPRTVSQRQDDSASHHTATGVRYVLGRFVLFQSAHTHLPSYNHQAATLMLTSRSGSSSGSSRRRPEPSSKHRRRRCRRSCRGRSRGGGTKPSEARARRGGSGSGSGGGAGCWRRAFAKAEAR